MRALVFTGLHKMEIQEREMPKLAHSRSVIVKVRAMGICGSDLHIFNGKHSFAQYPIVPGHEIAGEVYEVGPGVTTLRVGDRVVLEPIHYCGSCYACRKGQNNVCENLRVAGAHYDGGCQEFYMEDETNWHKIPDTLQWSHAVMVEPYTIGAQVVARGKIGAGDVVLIHGAGPAGLIALDMAKEAGAVVAVAELVEKRLELAKEFGADLVIDAKTQDTAERIMEFTNGKGPTAVIDAAGIPTSFGDAVKILSPAGTIVTMTFSPVPVPVQADLITLKELNIVGSRLQINKFGPVIERMTSRTARIDRMITHSFPIEQACKAVEAANSRSVDVGKVIITFDGKDGMHGEHQTGL